MTAKETLKQYIADTGEGWHGVQNDRNAVKKFSKVKQRLLNEPEAITEDMCHRILLDLGFKMVREPEYKKVN